MVRKAAGGAGMGASLEEGTDHVRIQQKSTAVRAPSVLDTPSGICDLSPWSGGVGEERLCIWEGK